MKNKKIHYNIKNMLKKIIFLIFLGIFNLSDKKYNGTMEFSDYNIVCDRI